MKQTIQATNLYVIRAINAVPTAIPVVMMEDEIIHTDDNPNCDDPTCPCNANTVESTMPDDIRKYYEPIEERSYDHPGVPAPCWENVEEDEEYPLSNRTFEYTLPENGRTSRTSSSRWGLELD